MKWIRAAIMGMIVGALTSAAAMLVVIGATKLWVSPATAKHGVQFEGAVADDSETVFTSIGWHQMMIEFDGGSDGHTFNVVTFTPYYDDTRLLLRFPGLGVREFCWSGGSWHEEPPPEGEHDLWMGGWHFHGGWHKEAW